MWALFGRLRRGREAVRAWAAGIAARLGGLAVLAVAAGPAGWPLVTVLVAYGSAVVALLMLEVFWLWMGRGRRPTGPQPRDHG